MASRTKSLAARVVEKLLPKAYEQAQPAVRIASKTLGKELHETPVTVDGNSAKGSLRLLQFWATILHNGRKTVTPQNGPLLIWFKDPKNDPRLTGFARRDGAKAGYPSRLSQVRSLTHEEFKFWSKENRKYPPGKGPMVLAKQSQGTTGQPFFSNEAGGGMQGFLDSQRPMIQQEMSEYVNELLREAKVQDITGSVSL